MNVDNEVIVGDIVDIASILPDNYYNAIVTSPPYFNLRKYYKKNEKPVGIRQWGGKPDCIHEFIKVEPMRKLTNGDIPGPNALFTGKRSNDEVNRPGHDTDLCKKCGAWIGELGAEPSADMFVDHLCYIFDLLRPKLRDDGIMFIVLSDSYAGSGGAGGRWNVGKLSEETKWRCKAKPDVPKQSLFCTPDRFSVAMTTDHRWILRNVIIWAKDSCMPFPIVNRYTIDWEPIFFFAKNDGYFFITQRDPLKNPVAKCSSFGGGKKSEGRQEEFYNNKYYNSDAHYGASMLEGRIRRCVWHVMPNRNGYEHTASYPEKLAELMLGPVTVKNNPSRIHVLDPFSGAGTTCVVAKQYGLTYTGVDVNPRYVAMAKDRLSKVKRVAVSNVKIGEIE